MIIENRLKLMQEKGSKDCMAVVAAMITGNPIDKDRFKAFAYNVFKNDGTNGYHIGELKVFLENKGFHIHDDILSQPAILIVKQLDNIHTVLWIGQEIWDPNKKDPVQLENCGTILYWLPFEHNGANLKHGGKM